LYGLQNLRISKHHVSQTGKRDDEVAAAYFKVLPYNEFGRTGESARNVNAGNQLLGREIQSKYLRKRRILQIYPLFLKKILKTVDWVCDMDSER
jgi:hypothetical protein